jgi:hypothetical protein
MAAENGRSALMRRPLPKEVDALRRANERLRRELGIDAQRSETAPNAQRRRSTGGAFSAERPTPSGHIVPASEHELDQDVRDPLRRRPTTDVEREAPKASFRTAHEPGASSSQARDFLDVRETLERVSLAVVEDLHHHQQAMGVRLEKLEGELRDIRRTAAAAEETIESDPQPGRDPGYRLLLRPFEASDHEMVLEVPIDAPPWKASHPWYYAPLALGISALVFALILLLLFTG